MTGATRAEVCVVACADAWRGDGEIIASPIGAVPTIGARLARSLFEPDLLLTDGEATLVAGTWALGAAAPTTSEGWVPYRTMLELAWRGRRHVMMGPSQIDRYGNANLSCIGDHARPTRQLLGVRGAPTNTVHHATSYWVPRHALRVFVPKVDMISGVGNDSAAAAGSAASRYHDLRRVVSSLAVLDFATADGRMRLASVHPGVTVDEVAAATGFELEIPRNVPTTRLPTDDELRLIRETIDPAGVRAREVAER